MLMQCQRENRIGLALLGDDPIRRALYVVGMMPAVAYFYWGFSDRLGADPLAVLERALGLWALRFLIASLMVTPIRRLGGPSLIRYRRALGLLAFYYAALHVAVYLVFDKQLDAMAIVADILRRPYISVGLLAFAVLVPLAVTSNSPMIRRLGARWRKLHRLAYVAGAAAAIHFLLVVKAWPLEPVIYAAVVAGLLGYRAVAPARRKDTRARASGK